jgi:GAF domain-containing protein
MTQNELQALVDDLAMRTGAPTVLEDHEQRMVVYSAQGGPIDEVRRDSILMRETSPEVMLWFRRFGIVHASAPLRIPSHPELGILGRLCVPVRFRGRLLGFLFLLDDERRLDSSDIRQIEQAAGHAALLLYEDELAQRISASVFSHLLTPDPDLRETAGRQLVEQGFAAADAPHAAVVVRLAGATAPGQAELIGEAMLELLRKWRPPGLLQLARADYGVLLVPVASLADDRQAAVAASEASAALQRRLRGRALNGEIRVVAGIGDPQTRLWAAQRSHREALLAARVAAAIPTVGNVARWRDLGAFRVLVQVPVGDDDQSSCIDPRLFRLLSADEDLAATVETYLDLGCDAKRTAERLQLHRTTLYYRLGKAAQLTGADLHDGHDRLALHMGFKLSRLTGRYPAALECRGVDRHLG